MKIEIEKSVSVKETIDVEFPYYFKHDVSSDHCNSVIFGKIELNRTVTLQKNHSYVCTDDSWELNVEGCNAWRMGRYFAADCRSEEWEFLEALGEFREFMGKEFVKS